MLRFYKIYLLFLCFLFAAVLKDSCLNAQQGLSLDYINKAEQYYRERQIEKNIKENKKKQTIREVFMRTSEYEYARSVSLQLDLLNVTTFAFIPSKLIGISSTLISQSVNIEHNFNKKSVLLLVMNLNSDISAFSPILNIFAKWSKIAVNINDWSTRLLSLWNLDNYYMFYNAKYSLAKLNDYGYINMTMREYECIIKGIILSPQIYQMK